MAQPLFEIGSHTQTGTELEVIFYLSFQSTEITGKCSCPQRASVVCELRRAESKQRMEDCRVAGEGWDRLEDERMREGVEDLGSSL